MSIATRVIKSVFVGSVAGVVTGILVKRPTKRISSVLTFALKPTRNVRKEEDVHCFV